MAKRKSQKPSEPPIKLIQYSVISPASHYLTVNPIPQEIISKLSGLDYLIYGGFVRDLIAKKHNPNFTSGFKDIDMIFLPKSFNKAYEILTKESNLYSMDHESEVKYDHWGAVDRVITLSPNKENYPKIQLGRSKPITLSQTQVTPETLRNFLLEPVLAVDIRCCSVAITSNGRLIEILKGAFEDCKNMKLVESRLASHKMNLKERMEKLRKRGWKK